jgi:hypothetical protein
MISCFGQLKRREWNSINLSVGTLVNRDSFMCAWNRRLLQRSTYGWQELSNRAICGRFANPNCANLTSRTS